MEIDNKIFQGLESFGKREAISKWPWKGFGFWFGAIIKKYPEMDITWCRIKHCICYVCPFYHL